MKKAIPGVGPLTGPIEEAIRETLLPALFGKGGCQHQLSENHRP